MITIRVGRRGQITIPKDIRNHLGIDEGDSIALIPEGDQAILRPIHLTLLDLRGSVPVTQEQEFDQVRQQIIAERAKRAEHGK
jgi:AbrB family looped-hinge helix DNA binding protein